jgi:hypothetical protein
VVAASARPKGKRRTPTYIRVCLPLHPDRHRSDDNRAISLLASPMNRSIRPAARNFIAQSQKAQSVLDFALQPRYRGANEVGASYCILGAQLQQ